MSNDAPKPIHYRVWIKPLNKWADDIYMNFTSYNFPTDISGHMQGVFAEFRGDDIFVEQYTGLNDKHGKPIYEGDILKDKWDTKIVTYEDEGYTPFTYCGGGEMYIDDAEIIGNIHEHPELLKGDV